MGRAREAIQQDVEAVLELSSSAGCAWSTPAALATAVAHLFDAVQLVKTAPPEHVLQAIASFENCWDLALAIFGFHLVGLGALLFRATFSPRWLALLVVLSGAGYLIDAFVAVLVSGSSLAVSEVTFVGARDASPRRGARDSIGAGDR